MNIAEPIKGIKTTINRERARVIRVHYSCDPDKDPENDVGKKWLDTALIGYRGMQDPKWQKEMEINFKAMGGQLCYPYLPIYEEDIYEKPFETLGIPKIAGLDYGLRNPSAFEVGCIIEGIYHIVWEYYEEPIRKEETEIEFCGRKGYANLAKAIRSCPYYRDIKHIFADPSLWYKTQDTKHGAMSIVEQMSNEGIFLTPGIRTADNALYERLNSDFWRDPQNPKLKIFRTCPWLWKELQLQRFAEWSAIRQETKNMKDEIVDKDNHSVDALKYMLLSKVSSVLELIDINKLTY